LTFISLAERSYITLHFPHINGAANDYIIVFGQINSAILHLCNSCITLWKVKYYRKYKIFQAYLQGFFLTLLSIIIMIFMI